MPRGDGTGPMGRGYARGMGRGMGPGAGYGCRMPGGRFMTGMGAGWSEKEMLEDQQAFLQSRLEEIKKQLEGLTD